MKNYSSRTWIHSLSEHGLHAVPYAVALEWWPRHLSASLKWDKRTVGTSDAFVIVSIVLGVSALLVLMLPPLHERAAHSDAAPRLPDASLASKRLP